MMPNWFLMICAGLTASLIPLQGVVNSRLGAVIQNRLLAATISFGVGTLFLVLVCLVCFRKLPLPNDASQIPPVLWTGGIMGCVFVVGALTLIPYIGASTYLAASIVGQLTMAIILDHYGVLGIPISPVTSRRVLGVALMLLGTFLIQKQTLPRGPETKANPVSATDLAKSQSEI